MNMNVELDFKCGSFTSTERRADTTDGHKHARASVDEFLHCVTQTHTFKGEQTKFFP